MQFGNEENKEKSGEQGIFGNEDDDENTIWERGEMLSALSLSKGEFLDFCDFLN